MNILLQEWRMGRKSLIVWIVSLISTMVLFMSFYAPLAKDMSDFIELVKGFPKEFADAFGISNISFGGIISFYSFVMTYVLLAGSVQAMNLGVSVLSAEVRDKTADFLYAKPVKRSRIITWKLITTALQLLLTSLCFGVTSWIVLKLFNQAGNQETIDFGLFVLMTGGLLFLQIFFAAIGLLVSVLLKRIRTVLPISLGVVFFFYVLYLLNETLQNAKLAYLSPFSYFKMGDILVDHAYQAGFVISFAILVVVFVAAAYGVYTRKDLPSI
jgi:ABC-2 type transport system permease protein